MTRRSIGRVVRGQAASDGAGVKLNRVIGSPALPQLDPFLLLDEFRSEDASDYIAGFPEHPHRGFETVTYMLAGRMRHADNQGNRGLLVPGSVQWMTAGRGIVHSEMPEQENGLMQGFQLWVNLPAKDKMAAPRYQDVPPERIPQVELAKGAAARVVAGRLGDATGPVHAQATEPLYVDVRFDAHARATLPVPAGHNAFVYVYEGEVDIGGRTVGRGDLGVLTDGDALEAAADAAPARFILVAGRPLKEPVARYGPFVMNSSDEIQQAMRDYAEGRL
jgi:redox-sensitive bicupin YhaK (pirin superfamily)